MCGISGYINFENSLDLARELSCIQNHRGPDAQIILHDDHLALSHQRLSIIDPDPRSDQPMIKDGLVIIYNGEIYNYEELKEEILDEYPEIKFNTTSDTEVLLELYRNKKEKCLDKLQGMFAFAIYETKTGQLFLARDHFGIKPLFYTIIDDQFAFASELKTLTRIPGFESSVNISSLVAAINYLWIPGNETMFRNCFKLPPASYLLMDTRSNPLNFSIHSYWQLQPSLNVKDEEEAIKLVDESMKRSIMRHMVADVPVSSFLSGGLDSSFISVLAAKINPSLSTFTIGIRKEDMKLEQMPDDEKYAALIAKQFHFDHHKIVPGPEIINELSNMVHTLDEPIGDPAAINTYLICKAAREKGVKVLLSGMGADEIFFGYRRQKASLLSVRYKKLPRLLRKMLIFFIKRLPVKSLGKGFKLSRWSKRFLSFAELPLEEAYMRSYSYYDKEELGQLFLMNIEQHYQKLREEHVSIFNKFYPSDPVNQMCFTDIHLFMQGLNLTYTDRASMAASVEVRVPFIDREVIETAMNIHGSLKFKKGQSKYILKKVAEKYLPDNVIYRSKASFGAPIRAWISGPLRSLVDELLSRENVERRGFFNYDYIAKMINEDRNGIADNAYRIYQLITVELWCRHFLDRNQEKILFKAAYI